MITVLCVLQLVMNVCFSILVTCMFPSLVSCRLEESTRAIHRDVKRCIDAQGGKLIININSYLLFNPVLPNSHEIIATYLIDVTKLQYPLAAQLGILPLSYQLLLAITCQSNIVFLLITFLFKIVFNMIRMFYFN